MGAIIAAIATLISWSAFITVKSGDNPKISAALRPITFCIALLTSALFLQQTLGRGIVVIPAGQVGVIETMGKVSTNTLNSGVYFLNPLSEVVTYSTRLQDIKETVDTSSKEGLGFNLDVSLQYRLDPQKAGQVFSTLGDENQQKEIIISRFRSLIRENTAKYDLSAIYGEKRPEISQTLAQAMKTQLEPLGFIVEEALLRNVILPENIQKAIQAKVEMEQSNQKKELELISARKDAERKIIEARGVADSQKILSESLTDKILKMKAIEATQKLAESQNTKVLIMGGGQDKLPLIFSDP
jgi:regulator of protease activity HflC (stomatin/prohibitin superfamily)